MPRTKINNCFASSWEADPHNDALWVSVTRAYSAVSFNMVSDRLYNQNAARFQIGGWCRPRSRCIVPLSQVFQSSYECKANSDRFDLNLAFNSVVFLLSFIHCLFSLLDLHKAFACPPIITFHRHISTAVKLNWYVSYELTIVEVKSCSWKYIASAPINLIATTVLHDLAI